MKFDHWGIICGIAAALIVSAAPVQADNFVIPDGVTVTDTQHLFTDETGTVQQGGTISVSGDVAIEAGDNNTINNDGTIEVGNNYGIRADYDNTIDNSGKIEADSDYGIRVDDKNTINNGGTIEAGDTYGIYANDDNEINNSGTIKAESKGIRAGYNNTINNKNDGTIKASENHGILAHGDNTINNSGAIEAGRDYGILASDDGNTINNSGTIKAGRDLGIYVYEGSTIHNSGTIEAGRDYGIVAQIGNTINNSGTIEADDYGILALAGNTINNYGSIIAGDTASTAIQLLSGNTLNLFQGSRIVGLLDLIRDENELNLHHGESWLMTISQANPTENTLNTFGAPVAFLNGDLTENIFTVATFDAATTVFAEEDDALADLTGAINSVLRNHLAAGDPGDHLWVQGIAARRTSSNNGFSGNIDHELAGAMAGFTASVGTSTRGGLFAGYADAGRENATGNHEVESQSLFGGAHARTDFDGIFANFTVTGGWSDNDSTRRIVNNQSVTGFDFTDGEYDGWFINPELTAGIEVPFHGGLTLVPSASVGYAGLFLDGFQESGSDASISLAARDVELLTSRLQLELQNSGSNEFGLWQTAFRVGVLGRSNLSDDDLSGILASTTAFTVALDDDDSTMAGFVGFDTALSVTPGAQIYLGGEAAFEDDGDNAYSGRIGANVKF